MLMMIIGGVLAHTGGVHDWPQHYEDTADIAYWTYEDGWYLSPIRSVEVPGVRLGLFVQKTVGSNISLEVRIVDGLEVGEWQPLDSTFQRPNLELLIQTFDSAQSSIQFRSVDPTSIQGLEWDILTPVYEPRQPVDAIAPPSPTQLSPALTRLGVVSRSQWGAMQTACTAPENDWYRMAIHHVASQQTLNGSVEERLQAIQAYAMTAGGFCDVPYQYMVGYDGTLLEGRPIGYYSGATGGGNNDGNIALSFIGCYDQSACNSSYNFFHYETEAMLARGREIIQVLSDEHGFSVDTNTIKAHQDWPGNATACPGQFVIDRMDELLSPVPPFYGEVVALSHTSQIDLALGEQVEVWVDVKNTGQRNWSSTTKLAPIPRDEYSALAHSSWESASRVQRVSGTVAPGATYRYTFLLKGAELGSSVQAFGLVEEGFTWFADTPYAGSPQDGDIAFSVYVSEGEPDTSASEPEPSDEEVNLPPSADAGEDQIVIVGDTVYLDGSFSGDPDGDPIAFSWTSVDQVPFTIEDAGTATPYFEATDVGEFELILTVNDGMTTALDRVMISVREDPDLEDEKRSGCSSTKRPSGFAFGLLLGSLFLLRSRRRASS